MAPPFPPSRVVEILAFDGVNLLDLSGPLQVFTTANDLAPPGVTPYAPRVVSAQGGAIRTSAGLTMETEPLGVVDTPIDTLLIPGGAGIMRALEDAVLCRWTAVRAANARRTASVCTGAFLLAAAGLLDGKRVATHWAFCTALAERFPTVRVESDPLFIEDGTIWTSAGISAGIDLALAFVERDCGRALALAVARHLVVFLKRPGGQAQFSEALALQSAAKGFESLHAWIADHLSQPLTVNRLAAEAGMSERSFARHYRAQVGMTPAEAVERLRVDAARRLMADSAAPLKRIATRCGFGSEETMRRAFLRRLSTSPQNYRARFHAGTTVRGSRIVSPHVRP